MRVELIAEIAHVWQSSGFVNRRWWDRRPLSAPKTEIGISVARRFWEPKGPVRLWDLRYLDCPLVHECNTAGSNPAEARRVWRGQPNLYSTHGSSQQIEYNIFVGVNDFYGRLAELVYGTELEPQQR